jgi:DNA repair protein RadC
MFCRSPEEAFFAIKKDLMGKEKEQVIVLHLNSRNRLLSKELISIGTLNESLISAREILKSALERNSCNLIIAHNHPSGDPTPSTEDIKITQHLHRACKLAGIQLMDHIIIANSKYSSLKSLGVLERR